MKNKIFSAIIAFMLAAVSAIGDMTVNFVDVGQGDCTVVRSAGEILVIDTGPSGGREALTGQLSNTDRIDTLVLTHPHEDHDANFAYLIDNYKIDALYMPEYADDEDDYGDTLRQAVTAGTRIVYPSVDDQFTVGDATVTVLSAADPAKYSDDKNLWSVVTRIDDGETSIIVMGDAEDINEYEMIDSGLDLDADILRVGHHGSKTSTTKAFVEAVSPDLAIISCGVDNLYGHPHQETLDTLSDCGVLVLRTDMSGTITVIVGESYRVQREKGG